MTDSQTWFYVAGAIGAVALAVGFVAAAASLVFGWKANKAQQGQTAIQIARVESGAKERIASVESAANERIETARAEASTEAKRIESEASEKIEAAKAQAQSDVAAARVRQDEIALELRAKATELADAQRKAAEAQLALKKHLEEVAERQKPRHLTPEQKSELVRLLRLIPKGPISFESIDGEPETYAFAAELSDAFIEAGWNASIMRINSIIPAPIGLHILVRSRRAVPLHGNPVAGALMAIGLKLAAREDPIVPEGEIILQVGSKE